MLDGLELPDMSNLPEGRTCADCAYYKRTCEWLIQGDPNATECDWDPSRFVDVQYVEKCDD